MTDRERYLETLLFGRPDRIPFETGQPRESTLAAWHAQGLPEGTNWYAYLREVIGIEPAPAIDRTQPQMNFRMVPQFEEKILERRERTLIVQDWKGNICEISDRFTTRHLREAIDFVTRTWIKCPVQTRADWEAMQARYQLDSPGRFGPDFEQNAVRLRQREHVVTVRFAGPWWQLREWCGFEGLCYLCADDPAFVDEMAAFWRDFVSRMLERILRHVVPDVVGFDEDMAYKQKAMISPAMTRRFLLPCWRQWSEQLRSAGVSIIDIDSDGYVGELVPIWIEAGANVCNPVEVAAGNNIVAFRREYGRKMAFRQGIDKRALAKGGAVMEAELARIEPVARDGGYIPGCDHGVPPDIAWPNFVAFGRRLAQMTGWL